MRYPTCELSTLLLFFVAAMLCIGLPGDQAVGQDATPDQTIKAEWQVITYSGNATVRRTRVPTGWLVIIESNNTSGGDPMMVTDPKHEWLNIEAERTTFGSYVAADRATYDAIADAYLGYVENDPNLDSDQKKRSERTVITWDLRLDQAETPVQSGDAPTGE